MGYDTLRLLLTIHVAYDLRTCRWDEYHEQRKGQKVEHPGLTAPDETPRDQQHEYRPLPGAPATAPLCYSGDAPLTPKRSWDHLSTDKEGVTGEEGGAYAGWLDLRGPERTDQE